MSARHSAPLKQRSRFQNPAFFSGGFFDIDAYVGTLRFMVFCILWIYGGRHIDAFAQWLWSLFGEELHVAPGKAEWHARVAFAMGAIPLVLMLLNLVRLCRLRRYLRKARPKTDEEVALRLRELSESGAGGYSLGLTGQEAEARAPSLTQRWPLLHDVVWGWPLLLALPLMGGDSPVAAVFGLLLGTGAYAINHAITKSRLSMMAKLAISLSVGLAAIGVWTALAPPL